jgi:hypothetical protein
MAEISVEAGRGILSLSVRAGRGILDMQGLRGLKGVPSPWCG